MLHFTLQVFRVTKVKVNSYEEIDLTKKRNKNLK